jgi:hypothetical protein
VLAGYGATVSDLAAVLGDGSMSRPRAEGPTDDELLKSLADAIRRVEGRQEETESLAKQTESRVERLEKGLSKTTG